MDGPMAEHRTKRDILQEMLDEIAPGWIIMKPTADAPDSLDEVCRFRKPDDRLSIRTLIQWTHFQYPAEWPRIKQILRQQIEAAKSRSL
jgi:hypothetical protein